MKVYRQWVPCERNTSYNFIPIFFETWHTFSPWSGDVHVIWMGTGQFTEKTVHRHIFLKDSSPTELKTVHRHF